MNIVLASSSPYRKALMQRLNIPFETLNPDVDESALSGETCRDMSMRLATAKALAGAHLVGADRIVIGSDQVAELNGLPLGKPLSAEKAIEQLALLSGQRVVFHTAVCTAHRGQLFLDYIPTIIQMRLLDPAEIERYVAIDQPLNSAGAMKTEALGITLMESLSSEDPTAIVGLPLIAVCQRLRSLGVPLP